MAEQGGKVEPRNIAHGFLGWVGGMHRSFSILFLSVLVVTGCSETRSKEEYAILQETEFAHRANILTNVLILSQGRYVIAGMPADDGMGNVWVLLNASYSPYYKQVPQWPFSLTASDMTQLKADGRLSDTVECVLETRVRSSMRSE